MQWRQLSAPVDRDAQHRPAGRRHDHGSGVGSGQIPQVVVDVRRQPGHRRWAAAGLPDQVEVGSRTAYRLRDSGFEQLMQLPILSLSVVVSLASKTLSLTLPRSTGGGEDTPSFGRAKVGVGKLGKGRAAGAHEKAGHRLASLEVTLKARFGIGRINADAISAT